MKILRSDLTTRLFLLQLKKDKTPVEKKYLITLFSEFRWVKKQFCQEQFKA